MLCVFLCCSQDISWKGLFCKVCTAQFTCSYTVFHGSFLCIVLGTKGQILDGGCVRTLYVSEKPLWLHWNGVVIGKWLVQTARVNKRRGRREGKMDHLLTQKQVELHVILVKYHGSISSCFFFFKKIYSVEYSSVWQSGSVLSICVWRILPVLLHRSLCLLKWMIPAYLMYCCALQRTTE